MQGLQAGGFPDSELKAQLASFLWGKVDYCRCATQSGRVRAPEPLVRKNWSRTGTYLLILYLLVSIPWTAQLMIDASRRVCPKALHQRLRLKLEESLEP
jgi:hypothetical protein